VPKSHDKKIALEYSLRRNMIEEPLAEAVEKEIIVKHIRAMVSCRR